MIEMTVRGITKLHRDLAAMPLRQKRALNTAIKVEGYTLRRTLIREIKAGAPGEKRFAPMRAISRRAGGRFLRDRPFANAHVETEIGPGRWKKFSMAGMVRYYVRPGRHFEVSVGWTGPHVSSSWKRIAKKQQRGFETPVTDELREMFTDQGARIGKRSKYRKYFFLRKTTRRLRIPARPIMEPFWAAHRDKAIANIWRNYRRKLMGKRI